MGELHLEGVRVLDLSRLLPGPMCTLFLADMGADVVKIEDRQGGDYARYFPPFVGDFGAFFASVNRNKRSMTLDLKAPGGADVLKRLVADADVLVESFRPGVLDRLGVGWETLREINPRLVYCAITGFGQTGPDRDRAGHDIGYMARTGLLNLNGRAGSAVVTPSIQVADIAGGALFAAVGILAALFGRERTGQGSFVDISMTEGAMAFAIPPVANHSAGDRQSRGRNLLTGGVPCYDVYETSDGRFLAVGSLEPKFWVRFVQAIGRPDLMSDGLAQGDRADEVRAEVAGVVASKPLAEWTEVFRNVDVCCEPVATFEETFEDAQHRARSMFFDLAGVRHIRTPVTPLNRGHVEAPRHGEHTDQVLAAAGFSADEIATLHSDEIV